MPEKKPRRLALQLGALTVSRLFLNTGLRMVYPFEPALRAGLGVTKSEFALLISIRAFAGVLSPIFSPLSERYGRRPILILSMLLFSIGCGIVIFLPAYWPLGVALSAIAVAKVIYDPAMQAFLGDTVPYRQRGRAVSITELSWAGSFLLAIPAIGFIMDNQGWQAPFFWLGAFGVLSAFMIWRALPSPTADGRSGQVTNLRSTFQVILRQPVIWAAGIYIMMVMGANELILIIYGGWMKSSFDLSLTNLGLATGIIGAAEILGEVTVGVAVDRLGKRPVIITTGLLAGAMYFAIPATSGNLATALLSLFILFLFFEMTVVGGIPLMTELVPSARGVVMSVILATGGLGRALGALAGPAIWDIGGFPLLGLVAAVIMVLAVLILALWIREAAGESPLPPQ